MNQNTYNSLALITTLIQYPEKRGQHGTGFFYNYNERTYLITNRHILEHEQEQPSEISIRLRDTSNVSNTERKEIPLYEDDFPRWLIHPFYPEADIAVLPLDQQLSHINDGQHRTGSLAISSSAMASPDLMIRVGSGARTFGYPDGYIDSNSKFPIARNGMIASPYGNWFEGQPQFLVDGVMGQGMSGSPVFTQRTNHFERTSGDSHLGGASSFFIGIHSGEFRETRQAEASELSLNQTWYSELVEEILMYNGLCDFVDSVSYAPNGELADKGDEQEVRGLITGLSNWTFFDPEQNRRTDPVDLLDEQIDVEHFRSLLSLLDEN